MQLRRVEIDFSDARVDWTPRDPEYAHMFNGISSMVPYLEGMLNKAVKGLRAELPVEAEALRRDVDLFTWQEGRHAKLHLQYNVLLQRTYPWLESYQARIRADFHRFLDVRGPKFALAYSEGFETYGPLVSRFFFERSGDRMTDWDEPSVYLWLWHFAEEYEHRTVCNHLFAQLYGDYWYRIYGLWYATLHLFRYSFVVAAKMVRTDRRRGAIRGGFRSRLRLARVMLMLTSVVLPGIVHAMSPRYDPASISPPRRSLEFLEQASRRYGVREPD